MYSVDEACLIFLLKFLNFSFPKLPQFVFSLLYPFPFSGLDPFNSFCSTDCFFPAFFKEFINFLFEDVYQLRTVSLKIFFSCTSAMFEYSKPVVVRYLSSSENISGIGLIIDLSADSWNFLYWVSVLFLGFWIFREHTVFVLPDAKFS